MLMGEALYTLKKMLRLCTRLCSVMVKVFVQGGRFEKTEAPQRATQISFFFFAVAIDFLLILENPLRGGKHENL